MSDPYQVVLIVLGPEGKIHKDFVLPAFTLEIATAFFEAAKRRLEGYH